MAAAALSLMGYFLCPWWSGAISPLGAKTPQSPELPLKGWLPCHRGLELCPLPPEHAARWPSPACRPQEPLEFTAQDEVVAAVQPHFHLLIQRLPLLLSLQQQLLQFPLGGDVSVRLHWSLIRNLIFKVLSVADPILWALLQMKRRNLVEEVNASGAFRTNSLCTPLGSPEALGSLGSET